MAPEARWRRTARALPPEPHADESEYSKPGDQSCDDTRRGVRHVRRVSSAERLHLAIVLKRCRQQRDEGDADRRYLYVTESRVDEGPTMKRFQPKDRGRAHKILKRTSHLIIAVDEKES